VRTLEDFWASIEERVAERCEFHVTVCIAINSHNDDGLDLMPCNQTSESLINLPLPLSSGSGAAVEKPGSVKHVENGVRDLCIRLIVVSRWEPDTKIALVSMDLASDWHDFQVARHCGFARRGGHLRICG
jgi:hypothetical protein